MGALLTGTIVFIIIGFLSYFFVSVLYRNDKDAQAYVALDFQSTHRTDLPLVVHLRCYLH